MGETWRVPRARRSTFLASIRSPVRTSQSSAPSTAARDLPHLLGHPPAPAVAAAPSPAVHRTAGRGRVPARAVPVRRSPPLADFRPQLQLLQLLHAAPF